MEIVSTEPSNKMEEEKVIVSNKDQTQQQETRKEVEGIEEDAPKEILKGVSIKDIRHNYSLRNKLQKVPKVALNRRYKKLEQVLPYFSKMRITNLFVALAD
mgnify:FL=1